MEWPENATFMGMLTSQAAQPIASQQNQLVELTPQPAEIIQNQSELLDLSSVMKTPMQVKNLVQLFNDTCHMSRIVRDGPGLSGTVPDFDTLSWYPRNMKLSRKFEKIKSMDFLRTSEGFVINKRQNNKCCIYCRVPIISVNQS